MQGGRLLPAGQVGFAEARAHAAAQVARLPAALRGLQPAAEPYPVVISDALQAAQARLIAAHPVGRR